MNFFLKNWITNLNFVILIDTGWRWGGRGWTGDQQVSSSSHNLKQLQSCVYTVAICNVDYEQFRRWILNEPLDRNSETGTLLKSLRSAFWLVSLFDCQIASRRYHLLRITRKTHRVVPIAVVNSGRINDKKTKNIIVFKNLKQELCWRSKILHFKYI